MITILFENPAGVDLPGTSSPGGGNNGGAAAPGNLALGTKTGTTLLITNSNGTGVVLPAATATEAGLLTGAKSEKLDNLPANFDESVDDRVAGLLVGGSNITLTYDDPANTLTISAPGGGASSGVKVITSIKDNLILEPVATGMVYCKQYWPGTTDIGKGGLFAWDAVSTALIDNGTVFTGAGSPSTGRWIRHKSGAPANIDDFGCISAPTPYNRDVSLAASGAPQTLLSSKFTSLALAQAWYPDSDILAIGESLNSAAIQQAHACQQVLSIPIGTYWINRTIELYTKRHLTGQGAALSSIICPASCGSVFKPLSRQASRSSGNEIYKTNMKIGGFSCWSDANTVDFNTGDPTLIATYDQTKSGFYSAPRKRDGAGGLVGGFTAEEANLGFPNWIDCDLSDMIFGRFAGDGFFIGLQFSSKFSFVSGDENAGYAVNYYANSGSSLSDCYAGRFNLRGGFNLPFGGNLTRCNGIDSFAKKRRWGTVGVEGNVDPVVVKFTECNFEGVDQALFIHGDATSVTFDTCSFQWWIAAGESAQTPFIRCYGGNGSVRFRGRNYFAPCFNNSPVVPNDFMRVKGNSWTVLAEEPIQVSGVDLTWLTVNALNSPNDFGYGNAKFPTETVSYPGNGVGQAQYGEYIRQLGSTSVTRLYIGRSQSGAEPMASFQAGSGAPGNGYQKGSIYIRVDTSPARMFFCTDYNSTTGASTWVEK